MLSNLNVCFSLSLDGAIYVFVVNHPEGKSQVEIFRFVEEENSLEYIKTIKHDLLKKYMLQFTIILKLF